MAFCQEEALLLCLHECLNHHAGGLVMSRTESAMRGDAHAQWQLHNLVFGFPSGVPVDVFTLLYAEK